MIARVDDELHRSLKERAAAEGRSLNDLVAETLAAAVRAPATRVSVRERARASGMLVTPATGSPPPSHEDMWEAAWGSGSSVSEALRADRDEQ